MFDHHCLDLNQRRVNNNNKNAYVQSAIDTTHGEAFTTFRV